MANSQRIETESNMKQITAQNIENMAIIERLKTEQNEQTKAAQSEQQMLHFQNEYKKVVANIFFFFFCFYPRTQ